MARELSSVIDHVGKLRELNTEGVEPTAHSAWGADLMRDDEPSPSWSPEMVLANAPTRSGNFFEVQAILD
jgi:aspartyl-tRNA(Asn)/glutamyl-tRNA(Gln) amidotransferase subunit C